MKIVIITPRVPEILDKGDKLRIFHQIKHLSISNEIHLISLSTNNHAFINKDLEKYITSFHVIKTSKIKRILNLIFYSITKKLPLQVAYYFSKKNKKIIDKKIHKPFEFLKGKDINEILYSQNIATQNVFNKKKNTF